MHTRPPRWFAVLLALALALGLGGCASEPARAPLNLSTAKTAVLAYVDDGRYERDCAAVTAEAIRWIDTRRPGERLAVVFDIDETVLSNLLHMRAQDFGYHSAAWREWVLSAQAPALSAGREVYLAARARDVAVLFLTGRRDPEERAATIENLRRAGLGDYAALHLAAATEPGKTARERKAAIRTAWAAEGWTLIAAIGDQDSDLGPPAERSFKLPNPFYLIP